MTQTPKAGMHFTHPTMLDPDWTPGPGQKYVDGPHVECIVTKVTRSGQVYYRYVTGGHFVTTVRALQAFDVEFNNG